MRTTLTNGCWGHPVEGWCTCLPTNCSVSMITRTRRPRAVASAVRRVEHRSDMLFRGGERPLTLAVAVALAPHCIARQCSASCRKMQW